MNSLDILYIVVFILSFIFFEYKIIKDKWFVIQSGDQIDVYDFISANFLNLLCSLIVVFFTMIIVIISKVIYTQEGNIAIVVILSILLIKYLLWQLFKSIHKIGGKK